MKLGQELYTGHFIHHVTFDHEFKDEHLFYRVLGDGHMKALNAKLSYACIPRPGTYLLLELCVQGCTCMGMKHYQLILFATRNDK